MPVRSELEARLSWVFRKPFFAVEGKDGLVHLTGVQDSFDNNRNSFAIERVSACAEHVWPIPWQVDPDNLMQRTNKDITCLGCLARMPSRAYEQ